MKFLGVVDIIIPIPTLLLLQQTISEILSLIVSGYLVFGVVRYTELLKEAFCEGELFELALSALLWSFHAE